MRATLLSCLFAIAALALGCGDGIDRWEGDGCQPACTASGSPSEGLRTAQCVDEDNDHAPCAGMSLGTAYCPDGTEGVPSCDTDDGKPRCSGGIERPLCGL